MQRSASRPIGEHREASQRNECMVAAMDSQSLQEVAVGPPVAGLPAVSSRTDPELAQPDRDPGIHAFVAAAAPSNSFIGAHGATRSVQWAAYVEHEVPKSKHSHVRNESLVRPARHQRLPLALPTTRMRTRPGRARSSLGSGSGGPLGSAGEERLAERLRWEVPDELLLDRSLDCPL